MNDGKGTSLVLVRTGNGKKLFAKITEKLKFKEVSYESGVAGNKAEYRSALKPAQRDVFFKDMNSSEFEELKEKYCKPVPVSLKRKIKSGVKKLLIKTHIIRKENSNSEYGLLFILRSLNR